MERKLILAHNVSWVEANDALEKARKKLGNSSDKQALFQAAGNILSPPKPTTPATRSESGSSANDSIRTAKSTATVKTKNVSSKTTKPSSMSRVWPSKGSKRIDREIAAYIQKLERDAKDRKKQGSHLIKIRILLQERIDDNDDRTPLSFPSSQDDKKKLGQVLVDFMRQHIAKEKTMMECTCVMFYWSIVEPSFKKGVARLFQAMEAFPNHSAIQKASLAALDNVVSANPESASRIAPSIPVLIAALNKKDPLVVASATSILAHISSHGPSQPSLVATGALSSVQQTIGRFPNHADVQAHAFRVLSNVSEQSSKVVVSQMVTTVPLVVQGMQQFQQQPQIQLYGCLILANIVAGYANSNQRVLPEDEESLLPIVLHAMRLNTFDPAVQTKGLQLLWSILSGNDNKGLNTSIDTASTDRYELFFSEGGIDVVLSALKDHPDQGELALNGMLILKDFTRRSLDFQRAVSAKGGVDVVLEKTRRYAENHPLQEAAMACMRNICLHQDNRLLVNDGIPTLLQSMARYPHDGAIQAYGCDALGRLASELNNQVTILEVRGIETAMRAMELHPIHPGVQDRACFLLDNMTEYPPAMKRMQRWSDKLLPILANAKMPPKEQSKKRLKELTKKVAKKSNAKFDPSAKGWFGKKPTDTKTR